MRLDFPRIPMNTQKPSSAARSPSILVACVIVSAAPAAAASGATVVDAFTQGRAAITSWSNADNFTTLQPSFMSAANGWTDARFGSGGSGILGRRYVATNSWGATNATASGTMAGDGQFASALHRMNWINAIKGKERATCSFDYASRLTETMLLGVVAMRAGQGKRIYWDGEAGRITNNESANQFLHREYRKGWTL